jgi:hypothetical protein
MQTGLHLALMTTKSSAIIKHLLGRGLIPNATDADGHTPLDFAPTARLDRPAFEVLLVLAGAGVDNWDAVEQRHPGTTERWRRSAAWARRRSFAMFLSGLQLLYKPSVSASASAGSGGELTVRRLSKRGGRARGDVLGLVLWKAHRHIASFL